MFEISLNQVDAFVFDFDGVLTNNTVLVNNKGEEQVICSRSDGLAFDVLRSLNKSCYILSTEKNDVVKQRANKLNLEVLFGQEDKLVSLKQIVKENNLNIDSIFYVGNDLNDYLVMKECGYTACPSDSHNKIKDISKYVCKSKGGEGVVREIVEDLFNIDFIKVLYS